MANKSLEGCLAVLNPEIEVKIIDKYIENFKVNSHTFVLCHGKDAKDVFKNMPLTINDKTENQINEYLDYNNISGNIHFIKGDLLFPFKFKVLFRTSSSKLSNSSIWFEILSKF